MLRTWKILGSRGGFHLKDVKTFPYFEPDAALSPATARDALSAVSRHMDDIADLPCTRQPARFLELRQELDQLVYAYFGLTRQEQALVEESVEVLMPSIRPASLRSLHTPAQRNVGLTDYTSYANVLGDSLTQWRTRMGGEGRFQVTVRGSEPGRDGPSGIIRVDYVRDNTADPEIDALVDDNVVLQTLELLRGAGLRRIWSSPSLSLVPDTHIWLDGSLYLVRPATKRNWTIRQALRDAEHIVRLAQPNVAT